MSSGGTSTATTNAKRTLVEKAEEGLEWIAKVAPELGERLGNKWDRVPEEELGKRDIYAWFATFFGTIYTIKDGNKHAGRLMDSSTAESAWLGLIDAARSRCERSSPEIKVRAARARKRRARERPIAASHD